MTDAIASLVPLLATVLLHFLWQGALVGVLAWLLLSLLHAARPQARYALACGALLGCVLLPALTFAKLYIAADAGTAAAARTRSMPAPSPRRRWVSRCSPPCRPPATRCCSGW